MLLFKLPATRVFFDCDYTVCLEDNTSSRKSSFFNFFSLFSIIRRLTKNEPPKKRKQNKQSNNNDTNVPPTNQFLVLSIHGEVSEGRSSGPDHQVVVGPQAIDYDREAFLLTHDDSRIHAPLQEERAKQ